MRHHRRRPGDAGRARSCSASTPARTAVGDRRRPAGAAGHGHGAGADAARRDHASRRSSRSSFWLPGAMAAPTPVSAYLHAAAMVKAGIYLVARLAPGVRGIPRVAAAAARPSACVTMLFGGWPALRQTDLKLLLAYGTVSQLGFLMVLVGGRHPGAGHWPGWPCCWRTPCSRPRSSSSSASSTTPPAPGTCAELSGLGRRLPGVAVIGDAGRRLDGRAAADDRLRRQGGGLRRALGRRPARPHRCAVVLAGLVVGSALTVAYSARFLWGAFASQARASRPPTRTGRARSSSRPRAARRRRARARPGVTRCSGRWSPVRRHPPAAGPGTRGARPLARLEPGARAVGSPCSRPAPRSSPSAAGSLAAQRRLAVRRSADRRTGTCCRGSTGWPCWSPARPSAARCRTTSARSWSSCSRCPGTLLLTRAPWPDALAGSGTPRCRPRGRGHHRRRAARRCGSGGG